MGAWDSCDMEIVLSLLNNRGVRTEINEKRVQRLEELQISYVSICPTCSTHMSYMFYYLTKDMPHFRYWLTWTGFGKKK